VPQQLPASGGAGGIVPAAHSIQQPVPDFPAFFFQRAHEWLIDPAAIPTNSSFPGIPPIWAGGSPMIRLTRLNRAPLVLNSDLIEHIDVTPDTVITLTTGQILRVRESSDEVIRRIVEFRRQVFGPDGLPMESLREDDDAPELESDQG
jgi:flagellar protein FlbD